MSKSDSLLDTFSSLSKKTNFRFKVSPDSKVHYEPLTNDALFHIPLISMTVLVIVKSSSRPVTTGEIGRLVGILLEETISGFKGSSQVLGWSATLGHRTAEAVVFLEQLKFLNVTKERDIEIAEEGNKFILGVRKEPSDLGQAVRGFFRNIEACFNRSERLL